MGRHDAAADDRRRRWPWWALALGLVGAMLWWQPWQERAGAPARQAQAAADASPPPWSASPFERVAVQPQPVSPPPAVVPVLQAQQFRCVDEMRQPIAGASVRLVRMSAGADAPLQATTDAGGEAVFAEVAAGNYTIAASQGHRHYVPGADDTVAPLHGPPRDLELRELWIGGLVMTGVAVIRHEFTMHGFTASTCTFDRTAEQQLEQEWRQRFPEAVFCIGVRDRRQQPADAVPMQVLWYGHRRYQQMVRMYPASQFRGPEVVDAAAVPACDWVRARVVLTDGLGKPLPEVLQAVLRQRGDLQGGVDARGPDPRGSASARQPDGFACYTFRNGSVALPVGDYDLRLFDGDCHMLPTARCAVAADTGELRIAVAVHDRIVRLHVRGVGGAAYMLQLVHESGRRLREFGRQGGDHMLLLPPGSCMLTCSMASADGQRRQVERALIIGDEIEQELTWEIAVAR